MSEKIQVLFIEDNEIDAEIFGKMLTRNHANQIDLFHAPNLTEGVKLLMERKFDLILLDIVLPESHGLATLEKVQKYAVQSPIVVLTVLDDETLGLQAIQQGAEDYLVKGEWDQKFLSRVIRHAIERRKYQLEKEKLDKELRGALHEVKILQGFLPICASCKKIRNKTEEWEPLEKYISSHSEAQFSHGLCPDCIGKFK